MSTTTLDQILHAVEELTPEERQELIRRVSAMPQKQSRSILDDIPVIDVGPWPENLSLRREDMYGDDGR